MKVFLCLTTAFKFSILNELFGVCDWDWPVLLHYSFLIFLFFVFSCSLIGFRIEAHGNAGHGSSLMQNTANEKLLAVLSQFSAWRAEEVQKLAGNIGNLGKVCSINITMLSVSRLIARGRVG